MKKILILLCFCNVNLGYSQDTLCDTKIKMKSGTDSLSYAYVIKTDKLFTGYLSSCTETEKYVSFYKEGLLISTIDYYDNGQKRRYYEYASNGAENGEYCEWAENGHILSEGEFKNGIKNGFWTFYEEGYKYCIGTYDHGLKDGRWKYFEITGKVIKIEFYINGVLVNSESVP